MDKTSFAEVGQIYGMSSSPSRLEYVTKYLQHQPGPIIRISADSIQTREAEDEDCKDYVLVIRDHKETRRVVEGPLGNLQVTVVAHQESPRNSDEQHDYEDVMEEDSSGGEIENQDYDEFIWEYEDETENQPVQQNGERPALSQSH